MSGNAATEADLEEYLDAELVKHRRGKEESAETMMPVLTGAPVSSSSIVVSPKVVRPRSKSVPPRKSDSEKEADPLQSSLSYKRRIKILKERFQMHSPKTDAVQAVNRIVLDSATRKSVHVSQLGRSKAKARKCFNVEAWR